MQSDNADEQEHANLVRGLHEQRAAEAARQAVGEFSEVDRAIASLRGNATGFREWLKEPPRETDVPWEEELGYLTLFQTFAELELDLEKFGLPQEPAPCSTCKAPVRVIKYTETTKGIETWAKMTCTCHLRPQSSP